MYPYLVSDFRPNYTAPQKVVNYLLLSKQLYDGYSLRFCKKHFKGNTCVVSK